MASDSRTPDRSAGTPHAAAGGSAAPPPPTVLCVDDEANILAALRRALRPQRLNVLSADSGEAALAMLAKAPVDLVISDMRMPGMDGAQLLEQVHRQWPSTVRVLLTGYADSASAIAAINRGAVFRYLQKPWNDLELQATVREGLERRGLQLERDRLFELSQRQNAELLTLNATLESRVEQRTADLALAHEKLQRQYLHAVKVFGNIVELRSGTLAGHGRRVAELARDIARAMALPDEQITWIVVAALLHDIGMLALDDRSLDRPFGQLSQEERRHFHEHCVRGEQSLLALEDMQPVLPMVRGHHERWDGRGFPDGLAGAAIPLGARIVAVADTFDELQHHRLAGTPLSRDEARTFMRQRRAAQFDPEVLDAFLMRTEPEKPVAVPELALRTDALEGDMQLARDLISASGVLMLTAGHRLTPGLIRRIREFEVLEGSQLQIHVQGAHLS